MRVEILCSSRELFGADRSALRLAKVLTELGYAAELVVPAGRPEEGLKNAAAERGVPYAARSMAIASSRGVEGSIAPRRRTPTGADLTIVNSLAVLNRGVPGRTVVMLREWLEPRSVRHRALASWRGLTSDLVVAVSNDVLDRWDATTLARTPGVVIPNWLEHEVALAARPSAADQSEKEGILFLGRFNAWKGQEWLADAFVAAFGSQERNQRPSLTFVGAQPGTAFEDAASGLSIRGGKEGWRVMPFVEDPSQFLRRAALVVVPSLHPEPFGMVLLEALAHGCRVIAFPGGGPSDLQSRFSALEVVPRSRLALAAGLRKWWSSGGQAQSNCQLLETGRVLSDCYSARSAAREWTGVLQRLGGADVIRRQP